MLWKTVVFIATSLILIYISRGSLRSARSHGFPRLLAWECMLVLFLLNVDFWFIQPLAWNQLIAWTLLLVSLIPLGYGVHFLRTRGKPTQQRAGDPALLSFEKTTQLVTSGIYRFIRRPLYCSLLLLTWGTFFKHPDITQTTLAVTASIFLFFTAKMDEQECLDFFGDEYQEYLQHSKMFIPFVF
jgi:protein-S-isoprenylcysteine O-methyltransferase Ste14